jgi:chromatin remodeling complex protein RSC6
MVRTTKTTTDKTVTPVAPVASAVPAVKKTATKKAVTKASEKTATAVAAPVVAAPAAPVTNEVVEETTGIQQKMNEFSAKLQQISSIFSSMKGDFKTLEKIIAREMKAAAKASSKRAKRAGNRAPSGFVKPTRISDELAKFLGKTIGTEMARTDVSKEINAYIRANNLQRPDNGRFIVPDQKLTVLLKIGKDDELSYFNLQRYMKPHFIKAEVVAAAAAATA